MAPTVKVVNEPEAPYAKRQVEVVAERFAKGVEYAKSEKCDGLRVVAESANIRRPLELDFDLLADVPHLKMLSISPFVALAKKQKLEGLYSLASLKSLSFHHKDAPIDFSRLATLESLAYTFSKHAVGFESLVRLEHFQVWSLNTDDCQMVEGMRSLDDLHISPSKLKSLKGIRKLPKLRTLKLAKCPNLDSVEELAHVRTLRELWIDSCKNLTDFEPLSGHSTMESLILDVVETISWVPRIKNLKGLYFKLLNDGDLSPILKAPQLESVRFLDRRHYSHTRKEIDVIVKARSPRSREKT